MYSSVSEVYDKIFSAKNYKLESSQILELLDLSCENDKVVDIGCGTGGHAPFISRHIKYTGIDINQNMIARAKEKDIENSVFLHGAASTLNLNYYNAATSLFNVPNHIHNIEQLISFFKSIYSATTFSAPLIFDAWNGVAAMRDLPKKEVRNIQDCRLVLSPEFDVFNQTIEIKYHYHDFQDEKLMWQDSLKMTIWTPKTLCDCLKLGGYRVDKIYSGFGRQQLKAAEPADYKLLFYCKKDTRE